MNENLVLTAAGANLIQHFEGCHKADGDRYRAYKCPADVWTIGFGHTNHHGPKFDENTRWTLAQCEAVFIEDMETFEDAVRDQVRVELMPWQFDALVSFTYNCGAGNLRKSTLLKKVNQGDFAGAALEFHKWNKGNGRVLPGLVRRRASEALLFQNITDADYDGKPDKVIAPFPESMPHGIDNPDK